MILLFVSLLRFSHATPPASCTNLLTERLVRSGSLDAIADGIARRDFRFWPILVRANQPAPVTATLDRLTRAFDDQGISYVKLGSAPWSNVPRVRECLAHQSASTTGDLIGQLASLNGLPHYSWVLLVDLTDLADVQGEQGPLWRHLREIAGHARLSLVPRTVSLFMTHDQALPGGRIKFVLSDITDEFGQLILRDPPHPRRKLIR